MYDVLRDLAFNSFLLGNAYISQSNQSMNKIHHLLHFLFVTSLSDVFHIKSLMGCECCFMLTKTSRVDRELFILFYFDFSSFSFVLGCFCVVLMWDLSRRAPVLFQLSFFLYSTPMSLSLSLSLMIAVFQGCCMVTGDSIALLARSQAITPHPVLTMRKRMRRMRKQVCFRSYSSTLLSCYAMLSSLLFFNIHRCTRQAVFTLASSVCLLYSCLRSLELPVHTVIVFLLCLFILSCSLQRAPSNLCFFHCEMLCFTSNYTITHSTCLNIQHTHICVQTFIMKCAINKLLMVISKLVCDL